MAKEILLNEMIRGGTSPQQERSFFRASLPLPDYSPSFFETSPTMWAAAYDFEQRISSQNPEVARQAIEEWACLVLLHFCRILHFRNYSADALLEGGYDPDLWPVLSRTFPKVSPTDDFQHLGVLITSDNYVVACFYPSVIFFPGRGRVSWSKSKALQPYVNDNHLSWKKCKEKLLATDEDQDAFSKRLRQIIPKLPELNPPTRGPLRKFCEAEFDLESGTLATGVEVPGEPAKLGSDPATWTPLNHEKKAKEFLSEYPLGRDDNGMRTYYLVEGLPTSKWMTDQLGVAMPSPSQYKLNKDGTITVDFNDHDRVYVLDPTKERVVQLKDCFVEHAAYCGVPGDEYIPGINKQIHRQSNNGTSLHAYVQEGRESKNELVVWLAPISTAFVREFPDLMKDPADITKIQEKDGKATWRFMIPQHKMQRDHTEPLTEPYEVLWETDPIASQTLTDLGLAVWPPHTDKEWSFYAAYGTGGSYRDENQQFRKAERWVLVGQKDVGRSLELDADPSLNYISLLDGENNLPSALLLINKAGREAGMLFLDPAPPAERPISGKSDLSIDFGTSNSCLAWKISESKGDAHPLIFNLSPRLLWGNLAEYKRGAMPGFVPFEWGAPEGVFPSVLLAKKDEWGPQGFVAVKDNLSVEHLWRAGIPALYKERGVIENLYKGAYEKTTWKKYDDMKWSNDPHDQSARAIFLGRSLLYGYAELFFNKGARVRKVYFTYPLALRDKVGFNSSCEEVVSLIQKFCCPNAEKVEPEFVSESRAVASSPKVHSQPDPQVLELFVDTGGGSTDLALRHYKDYLVLDSFEVAGGAFFEYAQMSCSGEKKLWGDKRFRQHLARLLLEKNTGEELQLPENTSLKPFYSLLVSQHDTAAFSKSERSILSEGMREGGKSFTWFRTRMFFRHIIAYALLQACGAAAENGRAKEKKMRIDLTLGGNAWGLLMFGEFERSRERLEEEAKDLLAVIISKLREWDNGKYLTADENASLKQLEIGKVTLLNEEKLSNAKTAVAVGALMLSGPDINLNQAAPYTAININQLGTSTSTTSEQVRWNERWSESVLKEKLKLSRLQEIKGLTFEKQSDTYQPLHPAVSIFTSLENKDEQLKSESHWKNVNAGLNEPENFFTRDKKWVAPINYVLSSLYRSEDEDSVLNVITRTAENFEQPKSRDRS